MAFKFKTKKRPTASQAFAGGFAQGVFSGIQQAAQLSLQDRLKKQEEEKNRLKRELDLFNGMVSNIEQTQKNREAILRGKRMIIGTDGKTKASSAFAAISPEFTFTPSKEEEATITKKIESEEKRAMQKAGMVGIQPTELEEKQRVKESEIKLGLKPIYKTEEQEGDFLNTYNVFADGSRKLIDSKEKPVKIKEEKPVRTEEKREGDDQVFYNVIKDGTKQEYRRVFDKYKEEDSLMGIPESTTTVTPLPSDSVRSFSDVVAKRVNINEGDIVSDDLMGQLKFKGGDPSNLENYDFIGFPKK